MISFNQFFNSCKNTESIKKNETIETNIQHFKQEIFEEEKEIEILEEEIFKKGDFVIIIYKENSSLNIYKGYKGEIKTYFKGSITANVQLEACNSSQTILFPISHFIKRDFTKQNEKSIGIAKEYFIDEKRYVTIHYDS